MLFYSANNSRQWQFRIIILINILCNSQIAIGQQIGKCLSVPNTSKKVEKVVRECQYEVKDKIIEETLKILQYKQSEPFDPPYNDHITPHPPLHAKENIIFNSQSPDHQWHDRDPNMNDDDDPQHNHDHFEQARHHSHENYNNNDLHKPYSAVNPFTKLVSNTQPDFSHHAPPQDPPSPTSDSDDHPNGYTIPRFNSNIPGQTELRSEASHNIPTEYASSGHHTHSDHYNVDAEKEADSDSSNDHSQYVYLSSENSKESAHPRPPCHEHHQNQRQVSSNEKSRSQYVNVNDHVYNQHQSYRADGGGASIASSPSTHNMENLYTEVRYIYPGGHQQPDQTNSPAQSPTKISNYSPAVHYNSRRQKRSSAEDYNHPTAFSYEDKRIAGCLMHCIYAKNNAVNQLGWPTLDGLVEFYSEGVNEHGYFMATLRAVDYCLKGASNKYHINRMIEPENGQSCDLSFDVFDCISDKITEYCNHHS